MEKDWSFNHHRIFISDLGHNLKVEQTKKKIKKHFGKKILYITKPQQANSIISRSKLLKNVEIQYNGEISNLKSKGHFVILEKGPESFGRIPEWLLKGDNCLLFKKILRSCQKARIVIQDQRDFRLYKNLLALRCLSLRVSDEKKLALVGEIVRNQLNLEMLRVETFQDLSRRVALIPMPEKSKNQFFASLQKLSRLKKVKLILHEKVIQEPSLERDLEKFYQNSFTFGLSIKIHVGETFNVEKSPSLVKILKAAEYLCVSDFNSSSQDTNKNDPLTLRKEEKAKFKLDKRNFVKINNNSQGKIALGKILSYCEALEHLEVRELYNRIKWNSSSDQEIKGLGNIKTAVLGFSFVSGYSIDENNRLVNALSSPLFALFSLLKKECHPLQYLSLNLSQIIHDYLYDKKNDEIPIGRKNFKRFIEEISTYEKLKTFGLSIDTDELKVCNLAQILSNKSLESFQLKLHPWSSGSHPNWKNCFATEYSSEIKKLSITVSQEKKISLFNMSLLSEIQKLENLQIVELIDKRLELITFDFLYGFVTSLLEKKCMRKIFICTKVINNFYSEDSEEVLPKYLKAQFENMLSDISRELENRVNVLKNLQLEEMMVGKLKGYNFDYMLFSKEMEIVDKLFWTQNEMDRISWEEGKKASIYRDLLHLFKEI